MPNQTPTRNGEKNQLTKPPISAKHFKEKTININFQELGKKKALNHRKLSNVTNNTRFNTLQNENGIMVMSVPRSPQANQRTDL